MEITNAKPDWTSDDEIIFRAFLEKPTGKKLLPAILQDCPVLLSGGDINSILIRSGELRGFQQACSAILEKAFPPLPQQASTVPEYPPLEEDSFWRGDKLNEEKK